MTVRKFFDAVQEATESGGKQFDKSGKPLVGRYRDGTTPKESEKAYGAGQMQIGTARNTASQFGIPWDQQKFMTDKEYNLTLADKHMEHLEKKYGDKTIARAAYHSGEPRVDKAITRFGRGGFAQGLGPEGRAYIQMGKKGKTMASGGGGVGTFLDRIEATASNSKTNTGAVFNSDEKLNKGVEAIDQQLTQTSDKISVLGDVQAVLHQTQVAEKQTQIDQTRAVSDQITGATQDLAAKTAPIFEARGRVFDQLDKIAGMNPLERGLRGIFDLNYDQKHLEGQIKALDTTLAARASDFEYVNTLHSRAMTEIDRRYAMNTSMGQLLVDQGKEDLGLMGANLANLNGFLSNWQGQISSQVSVLQAQRVAKADIIAKTDINTIQGLMAEAEKNGGTVDYQGIPLSYKELFDTVSQHDEQQLSLESAQMAMASNRMDLADKQLTRAINTMTQPQLEAAIAAGGVYQGVQLPQDELTKAYHGMLTRNQLQAEQMQNEIPGAEVGRQVAQQGQYDSDLYHRTKGFMGPLDKTQAEGLFSANLGNYKQLAEAARTGAPDEVKSVILKRIAETSTTIKKLTDAAILRSAGGDKQMAGYIQSWSYGNPIDAGTASEMLVYGAMKGGLPEGMMASPEVKQVMMRVTKLVNDNRVDPNTGKPRGMDALKSVVTQQLGSAVFDMMGQRQFDKLWNEAPRLAKAAGLPLGKIDGDQWAMIAQTAARDADKVIADQLGVNVDLVTDMRTTGTAPDSSPASKQLFDKFSRMAGAHQNVELKTTLTMLNELPPAIPGKPNSEALIGYLRSSDAQKQAKMYTRSTQGASMGDYFLGPLSAGAFEKNILKTAESLTSADADLTRDARQKAQKLNSAWAKNPEGRMHFMLTTIPGVGKTGADALRPFIKDTVNPAMPIAAGMMDGARLAMGPIGMIPTPSAANGLMAQEKATKERLAKHKFEDPTLEAYRKAALRGWDESSTQSNGMLEQIFDSLKSSVPFNTPGGE